MGKVRRPLMAEGNGHTKISFSWGPNGSSNPLSSSFRGNGYASITRNAAGVWDVVFAENYFEMIDAQVSGQYLAAIANITQLGTWTPATKTLQVRNLNTSAVGVDPAVDANNRIHLSCTFRYGAYTAG